MNANVTNVTLQFAKLHKEDARGHVDTHLFPCATAPNLPLPKRRRSRSAHEFFTQSAVARPSKLYTRARDRIGQPHILRVLEPVSLTLSAAPRRRSDLLDSVHPTVTLLKIYIDTQMNSGNGTVNVGGNSTAAIVRWTTAEATVGLWGYCSKGVIL